MGNLHRRPPPPTSLEFRLDRLKQTSDLRTEAMRRYFDGIPHLAEGGMDRHWHNYINGTDEFHLHFDAVRPCCITYRASIWNEGQRFVSANNFHVEDTSSGCERAVLIGIRDGLQNLYPVASVIRLQLLDSCDMLGAESFKLGSFVPREYRWRITDEKLSAILGGFGVVSSKLVNEVIKSGPEVVANLPQHNADDGWVGKFTRREGVGLIGRIGIEINPGGIKIVLPEGVNELLQLRKMISLPYRPVEKRHPMGEAKSCYDSRMSKQNERDSEEAQRRLLAV
jgi:hypothetical protein